MKKIILFMLILCLASQTVGCKGSSQDEEKDRTKKEIVGDEKK